MADQGIPPGGGVNPPGGDVNTQFLSNSNKNYMKLKDYDAGGEGRASKILLCRSANAVTSCCYNFIDSTCFW